MRLRKSTRTNIEDLPTADQELTPEEAREVRGGFTPYGGFQGGVRVAIGDVNNDIKDDIIVGAGPGGTSHVK